MKIAEQGIKLTGGGKQAIGNLIQYKDRDPMQYKYMDATQNKYKDPIQYKDRDLIQYKFMNPIQLNTGTQNNTNTWK